MDDFKIFSHKNFKKNIISIFLAFFILYLIFSNFDLKKSFQIISEANFFAIFLALLFHYLIIPARAFRWKLQLKELGMTLPIINLSKILFFAQFFNGILPAKLGEIYRAHTMKKKYKLSISGNLGVIFIERLLDLIILTSLTILSAYSLFGKNTPTLIKNSIIFTLILTIVIIILVIVLKYKYFEKFSIIPHFVKQRLEVFLESAKIPKRILFQLIFYSILIWTLEIISLYLCTLAIGNPIKIWLAIFTTLASSLLTAIPITPAGTGAVEAGVLGIFALVDINNTIAITILILFRMISYWSHVIFGFIAYIFSKDYTL